MGCRSYLHGLPYEGIDINSEEVIFKLGTPENPRDLDPVPNYYYSGSGVRPGSFAKRGDYVLTQNNDANLINGKIADLYVQWPDSKNVGKAEIKCEGRGDYYGVKTLTYIIVPNDVKGPEMCGFHGKLADVELECSFGCRVLRGIPVQ